MKRVFLLLTPTLLFALLSMSCIAIAWPPPAFDMPNVAYTPDSLWNMYDSIKSSIGAMVNNGLKIFGITTVFGLIISIPLNYLLYYLRLYQGVDARVFSRRVSSLDRKLNEDAIIDDRVADMEISAKAKKRYRTKNPNADLEEKIYLSIKSPIDFGDGFLGSLVIYSKNLL